MQEIDMYDFGKLRRKLDAAITYGRFELAESLTSFGLRKAVELELSGEIEYFKGQLEILKGNYYEAIRHFDEAVKFNPSDGAAFNDRALCMIELDIIDEAFYYFDKGIEAEPDYATIYHNKGWLLNKIGRHRESIQYFRKALELEPDRAVTYENMADALAHISDYTGSLVAYQKAISLLGSHYSDIKEQIVAQIRATEKKIISKGGRIK